MRRRFFAAAIIGLLLYSTSFGATYGGGSGTVEDPYQIWTPQQMNTIGANSSDLGKYFKLMTDIDMSIYTGTQYNIIGNSGTSFTGSFDGNGHIIRDLTYTTTNAVNYVGLFGFTNNATIKNLGVENVNLSTGGSYAGGLVGYQNYGTIANCYSTGSVASSCAGGLVGKQWGGTITNCYSTGSITFSSSLDSSYSYAGGLVGYQESGIITGTITNCCSTGSVTSSSSSTSSYSYVGGLAGKQSSSTITNCYSTGSVTSSSFHSYAGGLVGDQYSGTITNCYSTGLVTSSTSSYIFSYSYAGGLVGYQSLGTITNCYSTSSVTSSYAGSSYAGGLAGLQASSSSAKIEKCYSTGQVSADGSYVYVGGLLGYKTGSVGTVAACFWDTQTSGLTTSAGGSGVQGKTTAQMKTQSTFISAVWDFANTWYMNGYPHLQWENINTLQAQIDAALDGDTIVVQPGVYWGRINFYGKNIILTSTNPQDSNIVASTIIRGLGAGPVVTFYGTETPACVLQGFTIEASSGIMGTGATSLATIRNCIIQNNTSDYGGGIAGCKGLISNCIIRNNFANWGGGLSWCDGTIKNCLIVNNTAFMAGNAIYRCNGQIINCTIVSTANPAISQINSCAGSFTNCILAGQNNVFDACTGAVTYSCYPGATGIGNISGNPLFINPAGGDYHLLPDSPCVDAGDPASDYSNEPWPNGSRIDMGAYGNTSQATLSRNVLVPLGFQIIHKTRTGRTTFEYELAVIVRNPNPYDITDVQMRLKDLDAAVLSVSDDTVTMDTIPAGATVTSTDIFKIVVDRSKLIVPGMLTWELTYYVPVYGSQQATMSMSLSGMDAIPGDITGDGNVNLEDFVIMSQQWNNIPGIPSADIAPPLDGYVGIEDMIYLAANWLAETPE